ncbi:uncharacterized protein LOC143166209 [Aptenodytes patagonicus]|uniref:uncharacterized protein LOC143166209 n=1 Tax=Aptenodytes patagonicus TaxID=9234 RepID=UPI003FA051DE
MYLHFFLLLFSSGVSSYFLPLKNTPHLQSKTKHRIIDEMLCLLKAEKGPINKQFSKPVHIKNQNCAHNTTETFICELEKIPPSTCMKKVKQDMEKLEKECSILKKSSSNDEKCSEKKKTSFSRFKESLEEFLKWVNEKHDCKNIVRSELGLYLDGKCSCPDLWKYRKGLL